MKVILIIIILSLSLYIGIQSSNYYKKRYKFFCNLSRFNNRNIINIIGQKNTLNYVSLEYEKVSDSKKFQNAIKSFIKSKENKTFFKFVDSDFSIEECIVIEQYFNSLGKNDTIAEKQNLESFSKIFDNLERETKEKFNKYSSMCLKLSFLFGCLISLLII